MENRRCHHLSFIPCLFHLDFNLYILYRYKYICMKTLHVIIQGIEVSGSYEVFPSFNF
jgi:hypothetical protein